MSYVKFLEVTKVFSHKTIIPSLNLEITKGQFVSLLGPSGCGKTTVLRMLAGLEKNTTGKILIDNNLVSDPKNNFFLPPEKRNLGMVFQSYAIWPHMTVLENVLFPLKFQNESKYTKLEKTQKAQDILKMVNLADFAERMPSSLSGGQQQRVAIARSLVSHPKVLLLDEPLSNLDAKLRKKMCEELKNLTKHFNMTCLYVTHDQEEAWALSDQVIIMNEGLICQQGTPMDIRSNSSHPFVKEFLSY